jgi:rubrerythrin
MTYLEAASVDAFIHLARELEAHGASARLVRAARRAARDEVRHARIVGALARSEGGVVSKVRAELREVRSLEAMALENAVEGCVRETFGAACAMIQAERAGETQVRSAMKRIARDETRHAELSWAVARWIEPQLDRDGRRRVREAQQQAIAALMSVAAHEPHVSLIERLGIPSASQASALLAELQANLWSEPMAA